MQYARFRYPRVPNNRRQSYLGGVVQRRRKTVASARLRLAKPVRKLVDRRIDSKVERGATTFHLRRYQFTNLISDAPVLRLHPIIPDIALGDERNDRHGTQVRLTRLHIKGRIDVPADDNPIVGNDDRAQLYVRLFVLSVRNLKSLTDVVANWNSGDILDDRFFKNNASDSAPTGSYVDMLSDVNREAFIVHYDKVMKLDRSLGYFPDPTSTSGAATQRPVSRDFNITMKVKNKILKYWDPGHVQPSNYQPFVCALFAYGNGAGPSASAVPFIEFMSKLSFKDM